MLREVPPAQRGHRGRGRKEGAAELVEESEQVNGDWAAARSVPADSPHTDGRLLRVLNEDK